MPRPPKFRNSLSQWLQNRRHRQKQLEESSAKLITGNVAAGTLALIKQLDRVDFIHSQLPESVLSDRKDETLRPEICSLEWTTRALIQMLQTDLQAIDMDIRPLDQKLMTLVLMLQDFVAHGDTTAARTAADALEMGIHEIRCKLPTRQPDLAKAFVTANAEYLNNWIILVSLAQSYDYICNILATANAALREAEQAQQSTVAYIEDRLRNDPAFADAFFYIRDNDSPADRSTWSMPQWEVFMLLIYSKVEDFCVHLKAQLPIALENHKMAARQQLDSLRTSLIFLPNVTASELMNQFIKTVVESDVRMEETLRFIEELTAATQRLTNAFEIMDAAMEVTLHAVEDLISAREQLDLTDPDRMNKYNEAATRYIKAVTASDQRTAEARNLINELSVHYPPPKTHVYASPMTAVDAVKATDPAKEHAREVVNDIPVNELVKDLFGEDALTRFNNRSNTPRD